MGAWGCGIRDNDSALDLEYVFDKKKEAFNGDINKAFEATYEYYKKNILSGFTDYEDELFMFVKLQMEHGIEMFPDTFNMALKLIKNNKRLSDWRNPEERKEALQKFRKEIEEFKKLKGA